MTIHAYGVQAYCDEESLAVSSVEDDETDESRYLRAAEDGDWWGMPEEEPSNAHEIIAIAAEENWSWIDLHDLPRWLSSAITRAAEEDAHYDYCNRSYGYDDFDYAYNDSRYAEDGWAAYGSYVLDH